ncbi:MAG: PEGA domain-containing protein [Caldisericales bacterium]|nr:PEGA domain-containing protein [Caldisericales bacterium]
MNDRPTLISDGEKIKGIQRFSSRNPRFRYFTITLASVIIVGIFLLVALNIPKSDILKVRITSEPEGAEVTLDGVVKGNTPLVTRLKKGDVEIGLTFPGYAPLKSVATVSENNQTINYRLARFTGGTTVLSYPDQARIYIDEEFLGLTPLQLKREFKGKHVVKAVLPGFATKEQEVDFDTDPNVYFDLQKKRVNLKIASQPQGAELYIDEEYYGRTPWEGQIETGTKKIRLAMEGHRMVKREVVITDDTQITYSFESKDISFDSQVDNDSAPGAQIYICIPDGEAIDKAIPPLFLGSTPLTASANTIATYLTGNEKIPPYGLVFSNHPTYGATVSSLPMDKSGSVLASDVILTFPGYSSMDIIGQDLASISYPTLINEKTRRPGTLDRNPRYMISGNYFVDRDNPDKRINIGQNIDRNDVIVSWDEKYMACHLSGQVKLFDLKKGSIIKTVQAKTPEFSFTQDSKYLMVLSGGLMSRLSCSTGQLENAACQGFGVLVPVTDNVLAVSNSGKILLLWDVVSMRATRFSSMGNGSFWERYFEPNSIIQRSVSGSDKIVVLGKVFGLNCAMTTYPKTALLNIWMPEVTTRDNTRLP